ncbi:penicillin-binding protein 1C [Cytophagales bacterium LB-30]|uniref:peptidoglycan glycosyltransferase n=1 Tax=Shiella aurantiaca TaxID=3058365 RepID=A0ABT8F850_9BACT|nr:penicillin-binding protein 1C [Shiella aurantiaca]MDN4166651.1 penicillin-binding protein 1C [Shiella aurantiaca]
MGLNTGFIHFLHRFKYAIGLGIVLGLSYYWSLPALLFPNSYTTVLEDRQGELLSAAIAPDGQWRFPPLDSVPNKFSTSLLTFEDQYFYYHPGVNPFAIFRALYQNLRSGHVVSGGSTLSMQVIRMSRNQPRTLLEKTIEVILATRLELRHSKKEILSKYASHAPFGGNVVGLEAATWRYFGRSPQHISWAEAALLAVLPNSPALLHPGKNTDKLKEKRNRLLLRLHQKGHLDSLSYALALEEALPLAPKPLPQLAPHLLDFVIKSGYQGQRIRSTLDKTWQLRLLDKVQNHKSRLAAQQVFNAAAVLIEVNSGACLAYVGNMPAIDSEHGPSVDIVQAYRSTGSILKPFLYAASLDQGALSSRSLVNDIPSFFNGFNPRNFTKNYEGMVPLEDALVRSLNIPFVWTLKAYGLERFHQLLQELPLTSIQQTPSHYGLSLILGGAETSLWEATGAYASMGRVLNQYFNYAEPHRYRAEDWHLPYFIQNEALAKNMEKRKTSLLSAGSIYQTMESLSTLYRPDEESFWQQFDSPQKIAWKTGTSYGFRDAWAIGVNPQYAVGVWVGNADGEGRPELTGVKMAAPLLFDVWSFLPASPWFEKPNSDLREIKVCSTSGLLPSEYCTDTQVLLQPYTTVQDLGKCSYHVQVFLDKEEQFQINSSCYSLSESKSQTWFVLPPVQAFYYQKNHLHYQALPPFAPYCSAGHSAKSLMDIIYPKDLSKVFIPKELNEEKGKVVFEAVHQEKSVIYWHLDHEYLGATQGIHQMGIYASAGKHTLTLVDEKGRSISQSIEVLSK